jgi:hypothetical protein
MKTPNSGDVVIGTRPAWELWAESQLKREARWERLIAAGAFTISDLAKKNGWSLSKAKNYLARTPLKYEVANDSREFKNPPVRFYFPPGVNPPNQHKR